MKKQYVTLNIEGGSASPIIKLKTINKICIRGNCGFYAKSELNGLTYHNCNALPGSDRTSIPDGCLWCGYALEAWYRTQAETRARDAEKRKVWEARFTKKKED